MKKYYVYFVTNKNNTTLYVGVTSDLIKRIYQHKTKTFKGFTSKYNCDKLVYFEEYNTIDDLLSGNRNCTCPADDPQPSARINRSDHSRPDSRRQCNRHQDHGVAAADRVALRQPGHVRRYRHCLCAAQLYRHARSDQIFPAPA